MNNNETEHFAPEVGSPVPREPELADKKTLAHRYGVSTRTVDHWIARKLIPVLRFGPRLVRFPVREVDRVLAERFKINAR